MKCTRLPRSVLATCLFAVSFLIVLPAQAAQIDVPLNNLQGQLQYNAGGGLSASGISGTGNLLLGDLDFSIPDVSSTTFNSILTGSAPVLATLSLSGTSAGQSATVSVSDTFTDLMSLGAFFSPMADENNVLQFSSGTISGAFSAVLSDIFVNATNRGFGEAPGSGSNQLTSGTANLVATTDNFFGNIQNGQFAFNGNGTLNLQQVSADVPEPAHLGLLALALLGTGLIWRRKDRASRM